MSYFKPLRRKIGVATLVMACLFAVGWVRSRTIRDLIMFPGVIHKSNRMLLATVDNLVSSNNTIFWERAHEEAADASEEDVDLGSPYPRWLFGSAADWADGEIPDVTWRWRWIGFGVGETAHIDGAWITIMIVPYWSIVTPLTLLSAWLLLSKPRPAVPKKPVELTGT